jgi:IS1 family transposase
MLAPGDKNYNPHRAVDDILAEEGMTGEEGDGAMYAGDTGDHHEHHREDELGEEKKVELDEKEDMHNHFAEAVRKHIEEEKKSLGEELHNLKVGAAEVVKHGLRGANEVIEAEVKKDFDKEPSYYPYMTMPVSENYDFTKYEPLGGGRFAEYKDGDSPYTITDTLKEQSDELARSRRTHVLNGMKHIWKNYKEKAFGSDELHPISGTTSQNWGGMGTTLVDALDTLWLMGMKEEFNDARDWVRDHLHHSPPGDVSVFETTIRSLGGLLSAYDLSGDKVFLEKAEDLGKRLQKAYNTKSGLPHGSVNLSSGSSHNFGWYGNNYILAEIGTQQIEYRYLSHATGNSEYAKKSDRVFDVLEEKIPDDGLFGEGLQERDNDIYFTKDKVSFGAMGDSTYEYMIKLWIQSGKKEQRFRDMWDKSMNGLHDQLVQKSHPNGLTYLADREHGRLNHKMVSIHRSFVLSYRSLRILPLDVSCCGLGSSCMLHGWCSRNRGLH